MYIFGGAGAKLDGKHVGVACFIVCLGGLCCLYKLLLLRNEPVVDHRVALPLVDSMNSLCKIAQIMS